MSIHSKKVENKEKNVFAAENKAFICRYELIATRQKTKADIMRELEISRKEFSALEKKYLALYHGKK